MPPKRKPSQILIDELLEMGIDAMRDTILASFERSSMASGAPRAASRYACFVQGCMTPTQNICMSCRRPYCATHAEWKRADGFVICFNCFQFLWHSAKEAASRGAWDAWQKHSSWQGRATSKVHEEKRQPSLSPWEILGIEPDATEDQIKKAFRSIAAKMHPDVVPAEEREQAREKFMKASAAYDAMMSALKAAQR